MSMFGRKSASTTNNVGRWRYLSADQVCCFLFMIIAAATTSTMVVVAEDLPMPQIIVIDPWQIPSPNQLYPNQVAKPGDSIQFNWENTHNVYIHPTGDCAITDRIFVGQTSPTQYQFTDDDVGKTLTFTCDVGSHCEFGMIFNVTVSAADPVTEVPSASPSMAMTSTPAPVTEAPVTPAPVTVAPVTPAPVTPAPVTPAPTTAAPVVAPTAAPVPPPTLTPTTVAPTLAPVTPAPVVVPTTPAPTAAPTTVSPTSAPVTPAPVDVPTTPAPTTTEPSMMPSMGATTEAPVAAPTDMPGGEPVSVTLTGLRIGMAGVDSFPPTTQDTWSAFTGEFATGSVAADFADTVSDFDTTYEVKSFEIVPLNRRGLLSSSSSSTTTTTTSNSGGGLRNSVMVNGDVSSRALQADSSVIVIYDQVISYVTSDPDTVTPELLATDPFGTNMQKSQYVTFLGTSDDENLQGVVGVSPVEVPPQAPTSAPAVAPTAAPTEQESSGLSNPAIIGIACGGGALLLLVVLYFLYCRKRGGGAGTATGSKYQSEIGDEPPLQVSIREDEVSTLAGGPAGGPPTYGDQSVATVDYDYSKAYGGGGEGSISSAGGTFGSNTQNNQPSSLDPASAAATGAALGSMNDDGASFDAQYPDPNANVTEQVMHIFAPPGKLGVVIDTPDDGAPVVHAVKDSSVIASKIHVGDKLVAVDDEDVRAMTAIKVSKLISRKSANPSRKLTIVRTTVG